MTRKATLAGGTLLAVMLTVTGPAWACTPQPRSFSVAPDTAMAKSITKVVGQGLAAGAPVEVHWNSLEGNVIGTTTADDRGRFSVDVTVPEGFPGAYSVVFTAAAPDGSVSSVGRLPFRISPASGEPASPDAGRLWSSRATSPARSPGTSPAGPGQAVGIGLVSIGLVGLAGGSLAVASRRRRAYAAR